MAPLEVVPHRGRKRQDEKRRWRHRYARWAMSGNPPDYGAEIRKLRLERSWSRDRLAEESGLATSDIEAAERFGSTQHLGQIVNALGAEAMTLLLPGATADYIRTVRPIAAQIPPDKLPIALAECLRILARAAAGVDNSDANVRQYNVVSGDADIHQSVH